MKKTKVIIILALIIFLFNSSLKISYASEGNGYNCVDSMKNLLNGIHSANNSISYYQSALSEATDPSLAQEGIKRNMDMIEMYYTWIPGILQNCSEESADKAFELINNLIDYNIGLWDSRLIPASISDWYRNVDLIKVGFDMNQNPNNWKLSLRLDQVFSIKENTSKAIISTTLSNDILKIIVPQGQSYEQLSEEEKKAYSKAKEDIVEILGTYAAQKIDVAWGNMKKVDKNLFRLMYVNFIIHQTEAYTLTLTRMSNEIQNVNVNSNEFKNLVPPLLDKDFVFVTKEVDNSSSNKNTISVYIDDELQSFEKQPILKDGSTFVPMRSIIESLNGTVLWDSETRSINTEWNNHKVKFTINSLDYSVDNQIKQLTVAPFIGENTTYIPLRALAEGYGLTVKWDPTTQSVYISIE